MPLLEKHSHSGKTLNSEVVTTYWHVHWQDTWEPEEAMHNQLETPNLCKECMKAAAAQRAEEETRPDLPLSIIERQGHGHKPLYLQTSLWNSSWSKQCYTEKYSNEHAATFWTQTAAAYFQLGPCYVNTATLHAIF